MLLRLQGPRDWVRSKTGNQRGVEFLSPRDASTTATNWRYPSPNSYHVCSPLNVFLLFPSPFSIRSALPARSILHHCFWCYSPHQKISVLLLLLAQWFSVSSHHHPYTGRQPANSHISTPEPLKDLGRAQCHATPPWSVLSMKACLSISKITGTVCGLALVRIVFIHHYFHKCLFRICKTNVFIPVSKIIPRKVNKLIHITFPFLFPPALPACLPLSSTFVRNHMSINTHRRRSGLFPFKSEQDRHVPVSLQLPFVT